ncbi:MAG TPA: E3 binding domain-containing protein, partial [Terrimesophilobacter sp.]|nr:E3 binding domain-containing protein [Terrimesophilobacter sp.]
MGQPLAEVETEKATVEYEAEITGTVAALLIDTGKQVDVGTPIAVLADAGETIDQALAAADVSSAATNAIPKEADAAATPPAAEAKSEPLTPAPVAIAATSESSASTAPAAAPSDGSRTFMSPLVRRLATERGLDLSGVRGTGPGGRIVRRDLDNLTAATNPARRSTYSGCFAS